MKTIITTLLILLSLSIQSQNVNIPDANFKAELIHDGVDTNGDGEIQVSEAEAITIMDINDEDIADLTGIEAFVNLIELNCEENDLTNIDLSALTQLTTLNCSDNELTSIDISMLPQLTEVNCQMNQITTIDTSHNPNLLILYCVGAQLSSVDLSNNTALQYLSIGGPITSLDLSANVNLISFSLFSSPITNIDFSHNTILDELNISYTDISNIDLSQNTALRILDTRSNQFTSIDLTHNTALTEISLDEENFTSIDLSNNIALSKIEIKDCPITSIDVSHNTALINLKIEECALASIDVSHNALLEDLDIDDNNITSVDLSNNSQLEHIYCSNNAVTELNLYYLSNLKGVVCDHNQITHLDLSTNEALYRIICNDNQLEYLNVKNGNNNHIYNNYYFNALNNPSLNCIEVDDAADSTSSWDNIDAGVTFSEDCNPGQTYVPDDYFEQALVDLGYDAAPLDNFVTTANISTLNSLDISSKSINNLKGIEDFTALETLNVENNNISQINLTNNSSLKVLLANNNQINKINLTQNINLEVLNAFGNQLSSIDLTQNIALTILTLSGNKLTEIDVTQNTSLTNLSVNGNLLTDLYLDLNTNLEKVFATDNELETMDIKNGNNSIITDFITVNNPTLTCINVDDISYSTTNWTNIDSTTSFGTLCNYTYIPDDNFEQALIDKGIDTILDDYVRTNAIKDLVSLYIDGKNISDLTGIENFTSLTNLNISENNLSGTLDLSTFTLKYLEAYDNDLTTIILPATIKEINLSDNLLTSFDLSVLPNLEEVYLNSNQLTTLILPTTDNLISYLNFNDNQISNIDLSTMNELSTLRCENNNLTTLDLSALSNISRIYVSGNQLNSILINPLNHISSCYIDNNNLVTFDTSILSYLRYFECNNNQLTGLDLENSSSLRKLICNDNQLEHLWLRNGGNINITNTNFNATNNPNLTCIDVDDPSWSTSTWFNIDATASFNNSCQLSLNITTVGNGNVTVSTSTSGTYDHNETVELTAIPDTGWEFASWSGDYTGTTNPVTITMDSDKNITATFTQIQHTLTTTVTGNGSITLSPTGGTYNEGDTVQLTATPDAGWEFTGWNGDLTGNTNPENITMDTDKNVTATFTQIQHTITTTVTGNGSITLSPTGGTYNEGDTVQLTATPGAGWEFTGWNGDLTGNTNPENITMDTDKNVTATFTLAARTYVPDNNFEQALIDLGYDDVLDDYVLTSNINNISSLNLRTHNISDITGIEDFVALTYLNLNSNNIANIDISSLLNLTEFRILSNNLSNIDISQNTNLVTLDVSSNNLTSIDVSNITNLQTLFCSGNLFTNINLLNNVNLMALSVTNNNISNLDLSANINLKQLYVDNMPIASLDLSNNLSLEWYRCRNTQLTNIDVSFLPSLVIFNCSNNNLTSLNAQNGYNSNFTEFIASNNPNLTCIFVDDASYSTSNWTDIDTTTHFVETQAECDALSVGEMLDSEITIYPNPTNDMINIEIQNDITISQVTVFNMEGKILWKQNNTANISLQNYDNAMYFIKIETNQGSIVKRIIKE